MTLSKTLSGAVLPLTDEEKAQLEKLAAKKGVRLPRRAQAVLLAGEGQSTAAIAEQVQLSVERVRYWLRRYRREKMAIFEPAPASKTRPARTPPAAEADRKGAVMVEELCRRYSVNMAHVQHSAALTLRLFDATVDVHGLPPESRSLLATAALLHDIAYELDPAKHHTLGRDILLEHPIVGLTDAQQRMVACLAVFHRKKVRPAKDPVFNSLKKPQQRETLILAALLRLGDALDHSQTQTCSLVEARVEDGALAITMEGEYADFNAERLEKVADLWTDLYDMPVRVEVQRSEADQPDPWAALDPALNLPETLRILMSHYLSLIERDADPFREGDDAALVLLEHDIVQLFGVLGMAGGTFDATVVAAFKKDTRWLHDLAHEALIWQGVIVSAQNPLPNLDLKRGAARMVRTTIDEWKSEAEKTAEELREALDSKRYRHHLRQLLSFTHRPGAGIFPGPHLEVGVGALIGPLVWQSLGELHTEDRQGVNLSTQWRRVRRFLSLLDYFRSLLGAEAADIAAQMKPLETSLYAAVAAETALDLSQQALMIDKDRKGSDRKRDKKDRDGRPGVEAFIAAQQERLDALRDELEQQWMTVDSAAIRQKLSQATAALPAH